MLLRKDKLAAGELEGAKAPLDIRLYPSKMSGTDFLMSVARFFVKIYFYKNVAFYRVKKVMTFLTL